MPEVGSAQHANCQQRSDTHIAHEVDAALWIAVIDGIDKALAYMEQHGVEHEVAIRVLASPRLHRKHVLD